MIRLKRNRPTGATRHGLSLLELLATITILGVIAAIIVPRLGGGTSRGKTSSCNVNVGNIEIQAALWRRDTGAWPGTSLTTIGADANYFPDGLPVCPHGDAYTIDSTTGRVLGHKH